ncbi:unnamed protein product [Kuraishia capsulata CBS 1993]|uniref:FAD dependent oxidoreductase domain-containing protein n=1 Tax=Kuraishia capsulata CBS 1993 TaxID=1382522 RepID=W6MMW8_9ASCO|nr:uncharacterized protein KUCA_T00002319001 [Kuraishia capsulata CBS 1993]CDK26347.1 unnamed protein product [Kuraishia capsulata CBS 1993]
MESHQVLIIGAGTFGLSTALELLRKGHKSVKLLDPFVVPSPLSAGNDINKIFQSTVENEFYSSLALESLECWRTDPVYKPAFHETGIVYGATGNEAAAEISRRLARLKEIGVEATPLTSPEDFAQLVKFPTIAIEHKITDLSLDDKRFKDWMGYFQSEKCGWTFASLALQRAAEECSRLGAEFVLGSAEELLYKEDGSCSGVRTFSGDIIKSDVVVIAAGASSIKLLDYKGQLLAKCFTVGHIQLSEEEALSLKNSPVVLNLDEGFFFEPDRNNELKFCNEFPGYVNIDKHTGVSVPSYRNQIPIEAERQMRSFLKQVFPQLARRKFSVAKICWCTDTTDRHFLIGNHPDHKGLVLATGDSGQGFKFMPIIGKYISTVVLEGDKALDSIRRNAWKWRPEQAESRNILHRQGRFGGSNEVKDLKAIDEWTDGNACLL